MHPCPFSLSHIVNVSPKSRLLCSFRNASSKDRVIVQVTIVSFESYDSSTIRQAPHYYKPYFGYLYSLIMSYAPHVALNDNLVHSTPRVTHQSSISLSSKQWEWKCLIAYCLAS